MTDDGYPQSAMLLCEARVGNPPKADKSATCSAMAGAAIRMRVGVNTLFMIPGEVGGTETYLRETLHAITAEFPDISLVLFTQNENDRMFRESFGMCDQVEFVKSGFNASNRCVRILREQVELPLKVARARLDVLWSPGYIAPLFVSCPQVVTIHDTQYKTYPEDLTFPARTITDVLVKMAVRRCRRIIAVSQFSKSEIVKHAAARPDKIDVVYEAADPVFAEPILENIRLSLLSSLIPLEAPFILSVSHIYPHKNMHTLVNAFGEIMNIVPHNLVLVGSPRLGEGMLQEALNGLPDKSRVIRLQNLSKQQLIALYQGAAVFVFPSLYEGFGLPVLEAMTAGVPVITTRRASIPEMGGENVVYFDEKNPTTLAVKIQDVLAWSDSDREQWTVSARRRAKEFSWRKTATETIGSFRQAL